MTLIILKTMVDHKLNIAKVMISVFDKKEILWEKGEMLATSIFSRVFLKTFYFIVVKTLDCVEKNRKTSHFRSVLRL